jgi:catechol 2,3-dioxygenase-like lactoylglutathione lyase family enzyme
VKIEHVALWTDDLERLRAFYAEHFGARGRAAGVEVAGEPRRAGDGYYESVVLDPDGNRIELTV